MRLISGLYIFVAFTVASLFLTLYYLSGSEFCLIPIGLVLFDYIRAIRNTGAIRNTARRIPDRPECSPYIEFITEEEFKV